MISTLFSVHYTEPDNTLYHYNTVSSIREVHEFIRRVGHDRVIRINQREEDNETGYLSVRDLNLSGPPHFFENDVPQVHITEVGVWRNYPGVEGFGGPLPPDGTFTVQPMVQPHDAGTIGLETIRGMYDEFAVRYPEPAHWLRPDPMPGIRPGTVGMPDLNPVPWDGTPGMIDVVPDMETIRNIWHLDRVTTNDNNRRIEMATMPVHRTRAQEDRFQDLDRESTRRPFSQEESDIWQALGRLAPYIPSPDDPPLIRRDRVIVRVVRVNGEGAGSIWEIRVIVNGIHLEPPKSQVIRGLLSDEDKRFLPARGKRYENTLRVLQQALREGLQPQALHDSLKAWAISTLQQGTEATSETNLDEVTAHLLKVQPATLEVGGRVYKLIPAGSVDTRPLIARVRKKALAGVAVEAVSIREGATRDARIVVDEATQRANQVRQQIEVERRQAGVVVPPWVVASGRPHYWDGSYWNVEMRLSTRITEIRYLVHRWETILFWHPVISEGVDPLRYEQEPNKLSVWVRLITVGNLHLDNVRVRVNHPVCTHIDNLRCCMELQGLPIRVDNLDNLVRLEGALSRGMRVVNLNSPLNYTVSRYHPSFKEQLPPTVVKFLTHQILLMGDYSTMATYQRANPGVVWDRTESVIDEARGVFDVNTPVPVPVVAQTTIGIPVNQTTDPALNAINAMMRRGVIGE